MLISSSFSMKATHVTPTQEEILCDTTPSAAPDLPAGDTRRLARWIADTGNAAISDSAYTWAKHVTLDWLAVTIAGASEPLVRMLEAEFTPAAGIGTVRDARRVGAWQAALINGAAGHALDFDDVSARMCGHPSVPVLPTALALAQLHGSSGRDFLRAVAIGHEVEARIGEAMGRSHYARGFHATGTIGTFGAAAAAASLRDLDAECSAHALGLAAAQAAGLKSMFGTMAKPLHAGKAAMNGLMSGQLAARGFTANTQGIECFQGFSATQSEGARPIGPIDTTQGFAIEKTLFKYHASCYLTHSTIEAVRQLREQYGLSLDMLARLEICVPEGHLSVCDIKDPRTGLNVKFSIRQLALLALDGADTADLDLYVDETALSPRYAALRPQIHIQPTVLGSPHAAKVRLHTTDGRLLEAMTDVGVPATDTCAQWSRLEQKARAIATPVIGPDRFERLLALVASLEQAASITPLTEILE